MVKRAFSMQDLGSAIDHSAASDGSTVEKDDASTSPESETPPLSLRRSKSMNALDGGGESDAEEPSGRLPSIATLCLSNKTLAQVHGLEVLKRGAQESSSGGGMMSLPRSPSNSSLEAERHSASVISPPAVCPGAAATLQRKWLSGPSQVALGPIRYS